MKRLIQILLAVTIVLAVPLAGCGLTHAAGGVLMGGGGLTLGLIAALSVLGARGAPVRPPAPVAAPLVAAATPAPAVEFAAAELEFFEQGESLHELEEHELVSRAA